ncbi:hypothetical protein GCM10007359_11670 [Rothia aerolata]|uniref:Uncharacterized protein n=1 Tax=Rothia aerolata TaxID=1812262 RepID=A0A917ISG5_9MICC|nr:hypothetical protein GCM10007359_11670 [Rothia aerolata]
MAVIISRRSSYCPNFATALIRGIDLDGISQGAHPDLTLRGSWVRAPQGARKNPASLGKTSEAGFFI